MTTRLGLDIGTNSIGWCLYEGDAIKDIGVRIFSDGRDPKSGASLAVDRREARAMRRRGFSSAMAAWCGESAWAAAACSAKEATLKR